MLVTVTNNSATLTLNAISVGGNGVSPDAQGGTVSNPLPHPFNAVKPGNGFSSLNTMVATIAPSGSLQLPWHARDWRYRRVPWLPQEPSVEWNVLVQSGLVSLAFASETGNRDQEDLFIHAE